jgi:hypothetical protein
MIAGAGAKLQPPPTTVNQIEGMTSAESIGMCAIHTARRPSCVCGGGRRRSWVIKDASTCCRLSLMPFRIFCVLLPGTNWPWRFRCWHREIPYHYSTSRQSTMDACLTLDATLCEAVSTARHRQTSQPSSRNTNPTQPHSTSSLSSPLPERLACPTKGVTVL